jgi:hypothetical protein
LSRNARAGRICARPLASVFTSVWPAGSAQVAMYCTTRRPSVVVIIPVLVKMVSKTDLTDRFMYTIGPLTLVSAVLGDMTSEMWL